MRASFRPLLIVGWFVGVLGSANAWADHSLARPSKREARDRLDRGNRLYKEAKWEEAITEYVAGAKVEPAPVFFYNLGQCHRKRGEYQAALLFYERFVTSGQPEGEVLAAVQAFMAEMRAQLANRAQTMPPTEPEPSKRGDETPRISAPGAVALRTTEPLPADAASRSERPSSAPASAATGAAQPLAVPPRQITSEPHASRIWASLGWGLTAAGVVGGGVTTWLAVSAGGLDNDAKNTSRTISDRVELQDRADSRRRVALIVGIGSGAAVVLGVVTLLLPARADARATAGTWTLGITGNGVAVSGAF